MSAPTTLKFLLVGNGSAGKTSLCTRFRVDGFARVYKQTIGVDFYEKSLTIRGATLVLQVWDIGGQSIGSRMLPSYVRGAAAAFVVFDATDAQSFADAEDWLRVLRGGAAGDAPRDVYLLGNKADLVLLRRVSADAAAALADRAGLAGAFFVSARTGEGVDTAFRTAAARAVGVTLTPDELALTVRVVAANIDAPGGADDARTRSADEVEAADRAAAEAARRREEALFGCCAVA
jgi:Ras-related protein Rab-28